MTSKANEDKNNRSQLEEVIQKLSKHDISVTDTNKIDKPPPKENSNRQDDSQHQRYVAFTEAGHKERPSKTVEQQKRNEQARQPTQMRQQQKGQKQTQDYKGQATAYGQQLRASGIKEAKDSNMPVRPNDTPRTSASQRGQQNQQKSKSQSHQKSSSRGASRGGGSKGGGKGR